MGHHSAPKSKNFDAMIQQSYFLEKCTRRKGRVFKSFGEPRNRWRDIGNEAGL